MHVNNETHFFILHTPTPAIQISYILLMTNLGHALYAKRDFAPLEEICVYNGEFISEEEYQKRATLYKNSNISSFTVDMDGR